MPTAEQTRWTLDVSKAVDQNLKNYLQDSGDADSAAVSRFVEEAVELLLLDRSVAKIRTAFADLTPGQVEDLVDEAVMWARSPEGRQCE